MKSPCLLSSRAPSPSMREAIQGMLSMSRMGLSGMQLFSRAESRRQAIKAKSSLAMEDEEEQLSKCYQDDEYGTLYLVVDSFVTIWPDIDTTNGGTHKLLQDIPILLSLHLG